MEEMAEPGYLTLELGDSGEYITLGRRLLKYIRLLETYYDDGETVVEEDKDFELEWPLWQLIKEILTEYDRVYGTAIGPDTVRSLRKAVLLDDVQLSDLYRILRVSYHYEIPVMIHLLLQNIVARLLPLDTQRLTLAHPKLGRKPAQGIANSLLIPNEVINESYSITRELLMTAFTLYVGTYDLLALIEDRYVPHVTSILASGEAHVAVITQGGLLVKGRNTYGQLGLGWSGLDLLDRPDRWYSSPLEGVISVWTGANHTMVLTTKGLYAAGSNEYGQLGVTSPPLKRVFEPARVDLPQVLSVACGSEHTIVLTVDNVYAFGRNSHGQLAIEPSLRVPIPHIIDVEESMVQVACGHYYSLFLSVTGKVYHSGLSMDGIPVNTRRAALVVLPTENRITAIFAGARHAIMIDSEKEVLVWGSNQQGQLGLNDKRDWYGTVTRHPTLRGIVSAAACDTWSVFIDERGDFYACGANNANQLGLLGGSEASTTRAVKVPIENVISAACGKDYTMILTCEGLFSTGTGRGLQKEEIVKMVKEGPICKRGTPQMTIAAPLHCHVCGQSKGNLLLHSATQRILCSRECYTHYNAFRGGK